MSTGLESAKSGKYEDAFICFKAAAEQGYSKAQFNVGVCYEKGRGVHTDREKVSVIDSNPKVSAVSIIICIISIILTFLWKGSALLLASSSWGSQAGSVPPCKAAAVQQGAAEC